MKYAAAALVLIGALVGCNTPVSQTNTKPDAVLSAPPGSGTWHFSDQWWDRGIHFCEYSAGRNKLIERIENIEKCPAEVAAPKK